MSETLTEDELLRRTVDGDDHAIRRLLLSHYDPMLRYIESPDDLIGTRGTRQRTSYDYGNKGRGPTTDETRATRGG